MASEWVGWWDPAVVRCLVGVPWAVSAVEVLLLEAERGRTRNSRASSMEKLAAVAARS